MKAEIMINWAYWDEITEQEYANSDCHDTLMINDRGVCYFYKAKSPPQNEVKHG